MAQIRYCGKVELSIPRPFIFTLDKDIVKVGRDQASVDILLDSTVVPRMISRLHAQFVRKEGKWFIQDNPEKPSVNGCLVNEKRVEGEVELKNEDIIVFGQPSRESEFIYKFEYTTRKRRSDSDDESARKKAKLEQLEQKNQELEAKARKEGKSEFADRLGEDLMCGICIEIIYEAATLECSHSFCGGCINEWLNKSKQNICPSCRTQVTRPPVPARTLDNAIDKVVDSMADDSAEKIGFLEKKREKEKEQKEVDRFRRMMEEAKKRGFRVLQIKEEWKPDHRTAFLNGLKIHKGIVRQKYFETVGLSDEYIASASLSQLKTAASNIGLVVHGHSADLFRREIRSFVHQSKQT